MHHGETPRNEKMLHVQQAAGEEQTHFSRPDPLFHVQHRETTVS
jgi:hypothetical protein